VPRDELPTEIVEQVDMQSLRIEDQGKRKIELGEDKEPLEPRKPKEEHRKREDEMDPLSEILEELNDRFGTSFTEDDKVFIERLELKLDQDEGLESSVQVNTRENARLSFNHVVDDRLQELIDTNFKFYKEVTDNERVGRLFFDWLFNRYYERKKAVGE
jgi:type I restriction enzyme R subunit